MSPKPPDNTQRTETRWSDDDFIAAFELVDNAGRWGDDDELGTLNYITPEKRVEAARLVQQGLVVSLSHPLTHGADADTPALELQGFHTDAPDEMSGAPPFAGDHFAMDVHQQNVTHLDALSHIGSHHRLLYNHRPIPESIDADGIRFGSIAAQRDGIVTRGVFLDLAAALGVDWLEPTHEIMPADLETAEAHAGLRVSSGDALVVRTGAEALEAHAGPQPLAAGPGPAAAVWMHERQVAVYTGDAPDHISENGARILGRELEGTGTGRPPSETRFPLPFHQIAIPAMGLVLLDHAHVETLAEVCQTIGRHEFLFATAPLPIEGGSGSPVNPLAIL